MTWKSRRDCEVLRGPHRGEVHTVGKLKRKGTEAYFFMETKQEDTTEITGFHAHVYFDPRLVT